MDNAEAGPGPTTARIKFTIPGAQKASDGSAADTSRSEIAAVQPSYPAGGQSELLNVPANAVDFVYQPGESSQGGSTNPERYAQPPRRKGSRPAGPRGGRGRGRGAGRGSSRETPLGSRKQPTRNAGRQSASRTQGMMSDSDATTNRKVTISFSKGNNAIRLGGDGGRKSSFLGDYDRDLDENPSDPLVFEEQFVLRVPERLAGGLREMVKGKSKGLEGVELKFLDSRRAAFRYEGKTYSSKLVDLPNIIESQKTFDSRHLFKVADISQMLVVDEPVEHESAINASALNIDDYVWPHGITPPLRHVRKRRFRKRLSRRAIEVVEESVEELIQKDDEAEETFTDLIDVNVDPDVPDSYYIDYDPDAVWYRQEGDESEMDGSELYEDPGSVAQQSDWDGESGFYDEQEDQGDYDLDDADDAGDVYDDDLAAALREEMKEGTEDEDVDDDGAVSGDDEDEEGARSGDEEDDETTDIKAKIKQYTGEIKVLESTVEKKRNGFAGGNPIMVKRFEETIAGLQADINTKINARQTLQHDLESLIAAKRNKSMAVAFADPASPKTAATALGHDEPTINELEQDDRRPEDTDGNQKPADRARAASVDEDEDEDLFGDGDADEEDTGDGSPGAAQTPLVYPARGNEEMLGEDDYDDIDAEMAAMLNAELGSIDDFAGQTAPHATSTPEPQLRPDTAEMSAMDVDMPTFADSIGTYANVPVEGSFGVEGGVGMRRLATGVLEDDDDGDSDSSSSTD